MQQGRNFQSLLVLTGILLTLWAQPATGQKAPASVPAQNGPRTVVPASLYVDDDNAGAQDGSALRPYRTVQQAINAAKGNDVIAVAGGTYPQNIRVQEKAVRLYGGYVGGNAASYAGGKAGNFAVRDPAANPSHLKGDGKDSVVTLDNDTAPCVLGETRERRYPEIRAKKRTPPVTPVRIRTDPPRRHHPLPRAGTPR